MDKFLLALLRFCRDFFGTPLYFLKGVPICFRIIKEKTYYPEFRRKHFIFRFLENIFFLVIHGKPNLFYNQYGFDLTSRKLFCAYVSPRKFIYQRNDCNLGVGRNYFSEICLLRNKYLFFKFLSSCNISTPKVFGVIKDGVSYDNSLNELASDKIKEFKDYFIKSVDGQCASFVKHISIYDNLKYYSSKLEKGFYLLQERIKQDSMMSAINPLAVNTLRIVTYNQNRSINANDVKIFASILRVGTKISGNNDNTSAGGIAIGIHPDGTLFEYGFMKPQFGYRVSVHPDSCVFFKILKYHFFMRH